MTIDLDLDPELAAMLQQLAADSNQRPEELAASLLTQRIEVYYAQHLLATNPQVPPNEQPSDRTTSSPPANH